MDGPNMAGWPDGMVEIAKVIGAPAALKLSAEFGGFRVHVPKHPRPGQNLAAAIGLEAATKLSAVLGGCRVYVPSLRIARSQKARIAAAEGSVAEIARRVGCSERWARKVRSGMRKKQ